MTDVTVSEQTIMLFQGVSIVGGHGFSEMARWGISIEKSKGQFLFNSTL